MKYFLGIDQGGTKTQAIVADYEGNILGSGLSRGACHSTHGMDYAMQAIMEAAAQGARQAGIPLEKIDRIAGGLTGIDWPGEDELIRSALEERFSVPRGRIHIVNDCIIAMRAAAPDGAGAVLCAGTGLNCAVRDGRGGEYTYGFYIPDEDQGGIALGRRSLQAVYNAQSGIGGPTLLTDMILEVTGCESTDALLRRQTEGKLEVGLIAQLPRVLEKAALMRDETALEILCSFGRDAARYVVCGLARFDLLEEAVPVVLSGSVFKCEAPVLLDTIRGEILKKASRAVIVESEYEPIIGALLLGLDHIGGVHAADIDAHIKRDAQRFDMIRIS